MKNCNCISNSEEKILSHLREKHPTWEIKDARYQTQALMGPDYDTYSLYFEFVYEFSFHKVNGDMSKPKRQTVSVTPAFCPFCGKSMSEKEEAA